MNIMSRGARLSLILTLYFLAHIYFFWFLSGDPSAMFDRAWWRDTLAHALFGLWIGLAGSHAHCFHGVRIILGRFFKRLAWGAVVGVEMFIYFIAGWEAYEAYDMNVLEPIGWSAYHRAQISALDTVIDVSVTTLLMVAGIYLYKRYALKKL